LSAIQRAHGMYRVYVLENHAGCHYIGLTENVTRRLQQHNAGVSRWPRGKGPWMQVWVSEPMSLGDARRVENFLKRQKGGAGFYAFTGLKAPPGS
jgi:putative endonuclease